MEKERTERKVDVRMRGRIAKEEEEDERLEQKNSSSSYSYAGLILNCRLRC